MFGLFSSNTQQDSERAELAITLSSLTSNLASIQKHGYCSHIMEAYANNMLFLEKAFKSGVIPRNKVTLEGGTTITYTNNYLTIKH